MGYPRTMGAGLAGSTTKIYGNANVNQIQYGDKLQGLPPVTGRRDPYRIYKTKAGGNAPDRFRVFCINQLGGIGMANKNSQFAPNADGLGWCPNRKNSRQGDIGINIVDRGHGAIRFQSRADFKAEFEIIEEIHEPHKKTEPFSINGYYPLYSTEKEANNASSLGTSHTHLLNNVMYYMPDGLGSEQYHGTYTPSIYSESEINNPVLLQALMYGGLDSVSLGDVSCVTPPEQRCDLVDGRAKCDPETRQCNLEKYFTTQDKPDDKEKFIGYYVRKDGGWKMSWEYQILAPYQNINEWPTCYGTVPPGANSGPVKPEIKKWTDSLGLTSSGLTSSYNTGIGITFVGLNPSAESVKDYNAMFPPYDDYNIYQFAPEQVPCKVWPVVTSNDPSNDPSKCQAQYVAGSGDLTARIPYPQTDPQATKYLCIGGGQTQWKLTDFKTIIKYLDKITEKYYDGICLDIEGVGAVSPGSNNNIYDDLNTGLKELLTACSNNNPRLDVMVTISYFKLGKKWPEIADLEEKKSAMTFLKTLTNQGDTTSQVKYLSPQLYTGNSDPISETQGWYDVPDKPEELNFREIYKNAENLVMSYARPYTVSCLEDIEKKYITSKTQGWGLKPPKGYLQWENTNSSVLAPSAPLPVSNASCDDPAPGPPPTPAGQCPSGYSCTKPYKSNECPDGSKPLQWCRSSPGGPFGNVCCPSSTPPDQAEAQKSLTDATNIMASNENQTVKYMQLEQMKNNVENNPEVVKVIESYQISIVHQQSAHLLLFATDNTGYTSTEAEPGTSFELDLFYNILELDKMDEDKSLYEKLDEIYNIGWDRPLLKLIVNALIDSNVLSKKTNSSPTTTSKDYYEINLALAGMLSSIPETGGGGGATMVVYQDAIGLTCGGGLGKGGTNDSPLQINICNEEEEDEDDDDDTDDDDDDDDDDNDNSNSAGGGGGMQMLITGCRDRFKSIVAFGGGGQAFGFSGGGGGTFVSEYDSTKDPKWSSSDADDAYSACESFEKTLDEYLPYSVYGNQNDKIAEFIKTLRQTLAGCRQKKNNTQCQELCFSSDDGTDTCNKDGKAREYVNNMGLVIGNFLTLC